MACDITVTALNHNYPHADDYVLDRPHGHGEYVFIHFLTPFEILTANGIENGVAGDCILYAPNDPQWNRSAGQPLYNNWLHITGPGAEELISACIIPANRLFRLESYAFIEPAIRRMREELLGRRFNHRQLLSALAIEFYVMLGRNITGDATPRGTLSLATHRDALHSTRAMVQDRFRENWTVEKMAHAASLSRSRFSTLYKELFHVTPMEDLISARLCNARMLLSSTTMTIERIAEESGFGSVVYFHRAFNKAFGTTPGRWRA